MLPLAILAGGRATRLAPLSENLPKALIPISGEPFLARQLRLLRRAGIERVVLCVGHLGDQIRQYAGDGSAFDLRLEYASDGDSPLGTAGAIRNALSLLGEHFYVLYGDSYLTCDYRAVARAYFAAGSDALMTVLRNDDQWDLSNVEYRDAQIVAYGKTRRTDRMHHIDYGLGVFRASVFNGRSRAMPWDLSQLYCELLGERRLAAHEVHERFYEIGSWKGIEDFERHLAQDEHDRTANATFVRQYLQEAATIATALDGVVIERIASLLAATRERGGRLFVLGVGGSAANASHAVNDFRKIGGFEAYAPTDNVSELTARINDEGWGGVFQTWLAGSRLRAIDTVLVLSVGGGNIEKNVSPNLVAALNYARSTGSTILGIVGRDGGCTAQLADACLIVPTISPSRVTPHVEAMQSVVCHLLVSHPVVQRVQTKWESLQ